MTPPESLTDEQLVERIRTEDQELYRHIVVRYEARLMRYALTILKNATSAEDVLQSSFLKAFMNLRGFNTKRTFSSWIYRIVHNEALNYLKKHRRELPLDDVPEIQTMPDESESLDDAVDRRHIREQLESSLASLPLSYREPLTLYYLDDRSYQDISEILQMPIGTVGTRISRGLRLLRTISTLHPHD